MKKLLLASILFLTLPTLANVQEIFAWRKIPSEYKNWTRLYNKPLTFSGRYNGVIEYKNFSIRVSDVTHKKAYKNKKSGKKIGPFTTVTVQMRYDFVCSRPFKKYEWDYPKLHILDKSGYSVSSSNMSPSTYSHLEGLTQGTIETITWFSISDFDDFSDFVIRK